MILTQILLTNPSGFESIATDKCLRQQTLLNFVESLRYLCLQHSCASFTTFSGSFLSSLSSSRFFFFSFCKQIADSEICFVLLMIRIDKQTHINTLDTQTYKCVYYINARYITLSTHIVNRVTLLSTYRTRKIARANIYIALRTILQFFCFFYIRDMYLIREGKAVIQSLGVQWLRTLKHLCISELPESISYHNNRSIEDVDSAQVSEWGTVGP